MSKHSRLEAKVTPEIRTLLKRAAEAELIQLSAEGQRRFAAALINPPPLAPALERGIVRQAELIGPLE